MKKFQHDSKPGISTKKYYLSFDDCFQSKEVPLFKILITCLFRVRSSEWSKPSVPYAWWMCDLVPCMEQIGIYIPSTSSEKKKAFCPEPLCKTKAFLWGGPTNSPCFSLSQTGLKYSSFHPHSLNPHAHNLSTIRGDEIPRKIKELDLA